ncbi:MAG: hypothetical protein Q9N68_05195 [Gammaproteobacteria bacterium]|nr:hypothetical protein [Gammaproteobacteria bacterium]
MKRVLLVIITSLLPVLVWGALPLSSSPEVEKLARLSEAERNREAYALALTLLDEWEGDPRFDLYYGVSAIDVGQLSEGIFALERVLMINPKHYRARLELARGYFSAGENDRSAAEFKIVLAKNPPVPVVHNIGSYLSAIERRHAEAKARRKTVFVTGFAMSGLGYDSNVNAAPETSNISTPQGIGTLVSTSRQTPDAFMRTAIGAGVSKLVQSRLEFMADARYTRVDNQQGFIDTESLEFHLAGSYKQERNRWTLVLGNRSLNIDQTANQNVWAGGLAVNHRLNARAGLHASLGYAQAGFPGQVNRDFIRSRLFMGGHYKPLGAFPLTLSGSVYFGDDRPDESSVLNLLDAKVLSLKGVYGLDVRAKVKLSAKWLMKAMLQYESSQYEVIDTVFNTFRADDYWHVQLDHEWSLMKKWSLIGSVGRSVNLSNLALREYQRNKFSLSLRYDY